MDKKTTSAQHNSDESKPLRLSIDLIHATVGFYGGLYQRGSDKWQQLNHQRQQQFRKMVARGEQLEHQAVDKFSELSEQDSKLGHRLQSLRTRYQQVDHFIHRQDAADKTEQRDQAA